MKTLLLLALSLPCFAAPIQPKVVTDPVPHDSDDPAIWVNLADAASSLIIGTDKDSDGGLYAFDLHGKIVASVKGLHRPNNVDILQSFPLEGKPTDIAVVTERGKSRLRVFRLPDLAPLDDGDLAVFSGEKENEPMGIALYQRPDGAAFAIVGRKAGPEEGYLWQYRLSGNGRGKLAVSLVRKFGAFSGEKEIEAIAVDDGTVFYADERAGIRAYPADPDAPDAGKQLAIFGTEGFAKDREGIAISGESIIVSDQDANSLRIFGRQAPHDFVKSVTIAATECDGCDATATPLGADFPGGIFVAMSADRTFHCYALGDILGGQKR